MASVLRLSNSKFARLISSTYTKSGPWQSGLTLQRQKTSCSEGPPNLKKTMLNVLSFDGGGSKGIFEAMMLEDYMQMLTLMKRNPENFLKDLRKAQDSDLKEKSQNSYFKRKSKNSHFKELLNTAQDPIHPTAIFDMIAGTSTGSLIAFGLVAGGKYTDEEGKIRRRGMNVHEMIDLYREETPNIFRTSKIKRGINLICTLGFFIYIPFSIKAGHCLQTTVLYFAVMVMNNLAIPKYKRDNFRIALENTFDDMTLWDVKKVNNYEPKPCIAAAVARQFNRDPDCPDKLEIFDTYHYIDKDPHSELKKVIWNPSAGAIALAKKKQFKRSPDKLKIFDTLFYYTVQLPDSSIAKKILPSDKINIDYDPNILAAAIALAKVKVKDVLLASSNAPIYFNTPTLIPGIGFYIDGGVSGNCPLGQALPRLFEIMQGSNPELQTVISIAPPPPKQPNFSSNFNLFWMIYFGKQMTGGFVVYDENEKKYKDATFLRNDFGSKRTKKFALDEKNPDKMINAMDEERFEMHYQNQIIDMAALTLSRLDDVNIDEKYKTIILEIGHDMCSRKKYKLCMRMLHNVIHQQQAINQQFYPETMYDHELEDLYANSQRIYKRSMEHWGPQEVISWYENSSL